MKCDGVWYGMAHNDIGLLKPETFIRTASRISLGYVSKDTYDDIPEDCVLVTVELMGAGENGFAAPLLGVENSMTPDEFEDFCLAGLEHVKQHREAITK